MGLFDRAPPRPNIQSGPEYERWWIYWFKQFEEKGLKDNPPALKEGETLDSWKQTPEYWSEWRKYKERQWYKS